MSFQAVAAGCSRHRRHSYHPGERRKFGADRPREAADFEILALAEAECTRKRSARAIKNCRRGLEIWLDCRGKGKREYVGIWSVRYQRSVFLKRLIQLAKSPEQGPPCTLTRFVLLSPRHKNVIHTALLHRTGR